MAWKTDANLAILGGTRQGKSVLANQILAIDDSLGIFFAPDPEPWFHGADVVEPARLGDVVRQGADNIVVPCNLWDDVADRFSDWARALLTLGDQLDSFSATLAVDEAQDVDHELLTLLAKRGRKRGIRLLVLTQDPAGGQVPPGALTQCDYVAWVGPPSGQDVSWLQGAKVIDDPGDRLRQADDHQVTVVDRRGTIVWQGFADVDRHGPA